MINKFKIDFMVVGAQKAGTSAIDYYLRQHPKIEMASKKELHFFDNDKFFSNSKVDYTLLNKYFPERKVNYLFGEVTPSYMYWDNSIERIKKYNQHIKLIAILRNPIERAFSNWNMEINRNNELRSFKSCIENEMHLILNNIKSKNLYSSYVDRGLYAKQIRNMYSCFPSEQLLFIKYENYITNQKDTMNRVCSFLGIDLCDDNFQSKSLHKIKYLNKISLEERYLLSTFYQKDITEVEKLLNWDCSDWN